jgi:cell division protein FtsW
MAKPLKTTFTIPQLFRVDSPLVTSLLAVTALLVGFGLLMVLSATSVTSGINNGGNFLYDAMIQFLGALLGITIAVTFSRFSVNFWRRWRNSFVLLGVVLQSLVLFTPLGVESGGNRNWLDIGFTTIKPSEFIKHAVIVWLAVWLHDNPRFMELDTTEWRQPAAWTLLPLALVALGRDLGTSIVLFLIILGMFAFAGMPARPMLYAFGAAALVGAMYIAFSDRRQRFITWITGCRPEDYEGVCWQNIHGYWALGSGGLFGLGAGSSRSKWSWLPHADSDYIFAIIGEEFGLVGATFVIAIFVVLAITLVRLMRAYPQPLTRSLIGGVLIWLVGQAFINIGVVLGIFPVLGVPLPFVSSGGSALLANLMAVGVVVSCVRYEERYG